jgi:hypothetical protein
MLGQVRPGKGRLVQDMSGYIRKDMLVKVMSGLITIGQVTSI